MDTPQPVALVTGGSNGLGLVIARALLDAGFRVLIVGRDETRLKQAIEALDAVQVTRRYVCDVTDATEVKGLFEHVRSELGRLDALVNCVGSSDRGLITSLEPERLGTLFQQNVIGTLNCSRAAVDLLEQSQGSIVNIGSLASKVGARYLGGYSIVKHALAGLTQQMRLELRDQGVHVGLVSPGPIKRDDAGNRYQVDDSVPEQARQPGGGTRVKGLPPEKVAAAVLRCIRKREPDIVLPGYLRLLIALGHISPRLGDWLLTKFTSPKSSGN